jgi:hypothetical protein
VCLVRRRLSNIGKPGRAVLESLCVLGSSYEGYDGVWVLGGQDSAGLQL